MSVVDIFLGRAAVDLTISRSEYRIVKICGAVVDHTVGILTFSLALLFLSDYQSLIFDFVLLL